MKNYECEFEQTAVRAFTLEQADDELKTHVAACDVCTDALRVMRFMRGLNEASASTMPALPQAAHLWWKAQVLEQQATEERATRPILIAQIASYLVITLGFIGLLIWKLPQIQERLASPQQPDWLQHWSSLFNSPTLLSQIASLSIVLLCLFIVWALRAVLAED